MIQRMSGIIVTGSGDSANFNCGENLIKAGVDENDCEFGNGGCGMNGGDGKGGDGNGGNGEEELVTICHVSASGNEITQQHMQSAADAHLEQQ